MSNEIKVPCGGFKLDSNEFYFDENGALTSTLTGGGISDVFTVEITDKYDEEVTVDGQVYRKIGQFPKESFQKTIFNYTFYGDNLDWTHPTYTLNADSTRQYAYDIEDFCCEQNGGNIYLHLTSNRWKTRNPILFVARTFGIRSTSPMRAFNLGAINFAPFSVKISQITEGMLSWLYVAMRLPSVMMCIQNNNDSSDLLEGVLSGTHQSRGILYFNYYDVQTSTNYRISARINDWFNKEYVTNSWFVNTSSLYLKSPNRTIYKITVSNDGELTTTKSSS